MSNPYGVHDRSGAHIVPAGGFCLDTVALSENPTPTDYAALRGDINWIVRLNNGYGSTGTIPHPSQYAEFAQRCAAYAVGSRGVSLYIIGNEPNHLQERPYGDPITPAMYADCFNQCCAAIKNAVGLQGGYVAIAPAPVAPWDASTKYPGNANGDWVIYQQDMLTLIPYCDAIAMHTYTHGAGVNLITSEARMDAPFQHRHFEFRAYRDLMQGIPADKRGLPVYITETDQVEPWTDANTGWVQAAYAETDAWNKLDGTQKIGCLCLYRWPKFDQWHIEGKQGVIADFQAAIGRGYQSPPVMGANQVQEKTYAPYVPNDPPTVTAPALPRDITDDFRRRVPTITLLEPSPGTRYYRLIRAEYVPDGARRFGPDHHILVDVLDEAGQREMGTSVNFYWADGMEIDRVNKVGEPYGADYGMSSHGYGFGVWVGDFRQNSDDVFGMGLGTIEQPDWNHHVSYYLVFQRVTVPAAQPAPTPQLAVPFLAHPIADPTKRVISQPFGVGGHRGIDYAIVSGTPIGAVDAGVVQESGFDDGGYGEYIKLRHAWGESLYAHLSRRKVEAGEHVNRGNVIGSSGSTGNSTGPHLHLGIRVFPYKRGHPYDGFSDPLPYLGGESAPTQGAPTGDLLSLIRAAADEFGIDHHLLTAQVMRESSFNPNAVSAKGAQGLLQIMPATWREWSEKVGGTDPFNPSQNLRVGAAYLAWLRRTLASYGDAAMYMALVSYGWGIGNMLEKKEEPPLIWRFYASEIMFGSQLLESVEGIK